MSRTDPYRLTTGNAERTTTPGPTREDAIRIALWIVVVISTVSNMAASYASSATWVHLVCGVVTALAGGTLAMLALRGRR